VVRSVVVAPNNMLNPARFARWHPNHRFRAQSHAHATFIPRPAFGRQMASRLHPALAGAGLRDALVLETAKALQNMASSSGNG